MSQIKKNLRELVIVFISILNIQNFAFAIQSEEEIPFEQLVKELNSKARKYEGRLASSQIKDPFESLQIHTSFGFLQAVDSLLLGDRSESRLNDGIQLGLGIDLFSEEWVAEGILKNFGQSTQNEVRLSLREFDLRLSYLQAVPNNKMKFRLSNGLGARYLRYEHLKNSINIYQTTPIYSLGFGFLIPIGLHFDIDIEVQGHMALISDTIDRHGLGLILRMNNTF